MSTKKRLSIICLVLCVLINGLCTLNGTGAYAKIKISHSSITLEPGQTKVLKVKGTKKKASWSSSDKSVVTVSGKGRVKAKKSGSAVITAKVKRKKYTCKVSVEEKNRFKYAFRYPDYLTEHYNKHGIEMGFNSEDDYLAAANAVIINPDALHKTEAEDNDDIYYLEQTNEIVFVSGDGYIRTYFICSGKDYYDRQ